jgi:MerR family transcriptional regulator/heat shock protein HspR
MAPGPAWSRKDDMNDERNERAVYIISVAAELAGVHPQTLRIYERKGLLHPARTAGNTRRYSERDIDRLREIQDLTTRGVNLAGVKLIMELQQEMERARERMDEMRRELERARDRLRDGGGDIVPLRSVRLPWELG